MRGRNEREGKRSIKEEDVGGDPPGSNHRREERAKWLFTSILSPISEPRCQNRFRTSAFRLCRMMYVVERCRKSESERERKGLGGKEEERGREQRWRKMISTRRSRGFTKYYLGVWSDLLSIVIYSINRH